MRDNAVWRFVKTRPHVAASHVVWDRVGVEMWHAVMARSDHELELRDELMSAYWDEEL